MFRDGTSNFLGLGVDDALEDGSLGIEGSFKLGFKLDAVGVGLSDLLIETSEVVVATVLVVTVIAIVFLLVSNEAVFKGTEGFKECIKGITSLQLNEKGLEDGVSESCGIDSVDNVDGFFSSEGTCGSNEGEDEQCCFHFN